MNAETKQALQLDEDRLNYKLRTAVYIGNDMEVLDLLNEGANPNYISKDGSAQLTTAAEKGFVKVVRHLLKYGADINTKDNRTGKTALQLAEQHKFQDIVHTLKNPPAASAKPKTTVWSVKKPANPNLKAATAKSDKEIIAELRDQVAKLQKQNERLAKENAQLRAK
eukprot:TRINITY_DN2485_c0_g1_i3.p1 TRINITY_DN2485_c0_g1~~TRINITY_DN2485_c0_g1_i3.p1  ORF type:complete len:175 (-),score=49.29 TRINITY_DN2485_c0_g1_i3:132-632(-)